MLSTTFVGEIRGGQLRFGQPLGDFEGKQVLVALIAPDTPLSSAPFSSSSTGLQPAASGETDFLEDVGRIRMPHRDIEGIQINVVDVGRVPMPVYASDTEE